MAVDRNMIIKLYKEGKYVPSVMHLWVNIELYLVTRVVTSNKWIDVRFAYYSPLDYFIQN